MIDNPFSLMYGRIPSSFIKRSEEFKKIHTTFTSDFPNTLAYMITGIRGTGKTVFLRVLSGELKEKHGFLVVDLNAQEEMISSFAQKLYYLGRGNSLFLDFKLSIDLKFIHLEVGKNETISNPEIIAEQLINAARKKNKKILITIDEVNNTEEMRKFANFYQSMVGAGYDVFLLMTGLKKNIDVLIESSAASFLSRTPKITLGPLDLVDIAHEYRRVFKLEDETPERLARLTNGYAFAYQVIGYFFFESISKTIDDTFLSSVDEYLRKNAYDVIWNELTRKEKELCIALNRSINKTADEVMTITGMKESNYQNYRAGLIGKGILEANAYGKIDFALPRFGEFIRVNMVYYL